MKKSLGLGFHEGLFMWNSRGFQEAPHSFDGSTDWRSYMSQRRNPASPRASRRNTRTVERDHSVNYRTAGFSAAILLIAVAALAVFMTTRGAAAHPAPRADAAAEEVVHHSHYADYPRVESVYKQAAAIPHVLDGLHCYCECGAHSGHYSLLDCFKTDHGAGCDICLTSASVAFDLNKQGKSLEEIRAAVDELYTR